MRRGRDAGRPVYHRAEVVWMHRIQAEKWFPGMHPDADPKVGETVTGESHAWVEWFSGSWRGYDPTNLVEIGPSHVFVGVGRDYSDIAPLRGVYAGSGASDMFVSVDITRLE